MAIKKKKLPAKKKKTSGKAKAKVKKKKVVSKKKKVATKKKKTVAKKKRTVAKKKRTVAKKKKTVAKKKKAVAKKKKTPAGKKKAIAKKKKAIARKKASIAKAKAKVREKIRAKAKIAAQKAWIIEKARRKALRTTRYFFPHEIGVPGRWETMMPGGRYQVVGEPTAKPRIRPEIPTTTIFRDELPETTLEREPEQYRDEEPYYDEEPEVEIVRAPESEPEPEPEPAPEIPFYYIETGAAAMYSEPGMNDEEHYQYASNLNAAPLDRMTIEGTSRIASVFERAFIGALNKGPFEADEIHIYRHGVSFRPRSGEFTDANRKAITELLADYPGSSVHVTSEPGSNGAKDTFSIRINVGSSSESGNFLSTSENMDYHKDVFQAIYSYMQDEYDGDVDWNAFWDTEESMYE